MRPVYPDLDFVSVISPASSHFVYLELLLSAVFARPAHCDMVDAATPFTADVSLALPPLEAAPA